MAPSHIGNRDAGLGNSLNEYELVVDGISSFALDNRKKTSTVFAFEGIVE